MLYPANIIVTGGLHIMKKMIINENQKGFLFKNGKYTKTLDAGKYHLFGGKEIEISNLEQPKGEQRRISQVQGHP